MLFVVKYFSGAKIDDTKLYVKPEQVKQIIVHVGTNELLGKKKAQTK